MKCLWERFSVLFCLSLFCLAISAQEIPNNLPPNNLVLEVTYFKGNQPASQEIGAHARSKPSTWYARFQRIDGWQPKPGEFPVRAVNLVPYLDESGAVQIRVSVFTGEKFHDNEVFVADVSLRENERKAVAELTNFGVQPFELAVVRSIRGAADLPVIVNKTSSLQVLVEPEVSELPSFTVKLLNNSNKAVAAVVWETTAGARKMLSAMPQGRDGRALIAPNETYEYSVRNTLRDIKTEAEQSLSLVIGAVVFEDGSYEGEPLKAASFRSFVIGRRFFLSQAVPLWQKAAENKTTNAALLRELAEQLAALDTSISAATLAQLTAEFPGLSEKERSDLSVGMEVAARGTKKSMLGDLAKLSQTPSKTETGLQNRLLALTDKHQDWMRRLTK